MKKNLQNLLLALVVGAVLSLSSCSKDEPLPLATTNFQVTSVAPEVHVPVAFNNLSLNASYYVWDFGDGEVDSTNVVSPTHIYEEPGNYTVSLRSYNDDKEFSESTLSLSVGERFLTGFSLISLGEVAIDGKKIDYDTIRGIDLMLAFGPVEDFGSISEDSRFLDAPQLIVDSVIAKNDLPIGFTLNSSDYVLTNEPFRMIVYRVDSTDEESIYRTPLDYEDFNPLNETITFKNEDGQGGVIYPLLAQYGFQYFLEFEID